MTQTPVATHKNCTKCGEFQPLSNFYNSVKGKFGKTSWCKSCSKKNRTYTKSKTNVEPRKFNKQKVAELLLKHNIVITGAIRAELEKPSCGARTDIRDTGTWNRNFETEEGEIYFRAANILMKSLPGAWDMDHWVPITKGGLTDENNMIPLPKAINRAKSSDDWSWNEVMEFVRDAYNSPATMKLFGIPAWWYPCRCQEFVFLFAQNQYKFTAAS